MVWAFDTNTQNLWNQYTSLIQDARRLKITVPPIQNMTVSLSEADSSNVQAQLTSFKQQLSTAYSTKLGV